ncbi:amino acid adenylation domain-containing protein [Spartinivicinus ruber]|uniref:amino acid adenylation domain-containing protein n=1 Tax=Spartinivicinus ruber TaxID=2683272 RepID=UPI001CA40AC1|nr:amino acid adenylation domain-containing protein [Spartinivicinus ruber]
MNIEQVVQAGLKIKEKGMVVTGASLKEQLKHSDPRTLMSIWLKNSPRKDSKANVRISKNINPDTYPHNEHLQQPEDLYKKIIHDICEDSSEIINHLESKLKLTENKISDINNKLNLAEHELIKNKHVVTVIGSVLNKLNDKHFIESKNTSDLADIISQELSAIHWSETNNTASTNNLAQKTNSQTRKLSFLQQAISNLNHHDQYLFEQFGQGPIKAIPYTCIHHAFEQQATVQPNAIAAEYLGQSISYQALNHQANRLAMLLKKQGVKKGDNVALFLERSIPMLVGIFAVLKLGAAYVPQHVGVAPEKQLKHVIKAAKTKIILTLSKLKPLIPVPAEHTCIAIDEIMQSPLNDEVADQNPQIEIQASDNCFILFTSGTTGSPNGVQVTHGNVCNIILTEPGNLGIKPGMKVAQILSIAFDMAAWEILGCLTHGATLVIRGKNIQQAVQQADVVIATPSVLGSLDVAQCHNVKVVAVAGEPCPKPLADKWAAFCKFHNSCGPTETTIVNTVQHYHKDSKALTIGKPTPNNTVYILDNNMQPCAIGEVGEMWAGGDCVTAGYLDNPELNKERYAPDPFLGNGQIMFRTRDLGRWTKNGELEHFGRVDDQVKIRGFRVELDSVSAVLEKVPSCTQAVTLKLDCRHLVAFVSPQSVDTEAAKLVIADSLPYYCVPSMIFAIDKLPKTSRGKVDKRELLKIAQQHHDQQQPEMIKETS